jgi:hypothetical protein
MNAMNFKDKNIHPLLSQAALLLNDANGVYTFVGDIIKVTEGRKHQVKLRLI